MSLNDVARNVASNLLSNLGADGIIIVRDEGFDKTTRRVTENSADQEVSVKCSPPEAVKKERIEAGLAVVGDLETMIAAKDISFAPKAKTHNFKFDGVTYKIEKILAMYGGNDAALYTLILRS